MEAPLFFQVTRVYVIQFDFDRGRWVPLPGRLYPATQLARSPILAFPSLRWYDYSSNLIHDQISSTSNTFFFFNSSQ